MHTCIDPTWDNVTMQYKSCSKFNFKMKKVIILLFGTIVCMTLNRESKFEFQYLMIYYRTGCHSSVFLVPIESNTVLCSRIRTKSLQSTNARAFLVQSE